MRAASVLLILFFMTTVVPGSRPAAADQPVAPQFSRAEIEAKWRTRIQSFLGRGVIPLIDLESSLRRKSGHRVVPMTLRVMDELGVALVSFMGREAAKDGKTKGYRWSYYIHEIANDHPDRFILTTNAGSNRNWSKQKTGKKRHFIDRLERHVRTGDYPFIGEIEFRHYMSNAQCKEGKEHRDIHIPLNGPTGHRVFRLSAETGVPFSIHHEPEDVPLAALEEMLAAYPKANVIAAHFGQIRYPHRQKRFTADMVSHLLSTYPNLFFDLSTGEPGRHYKCGTEPLDTVIWEKDSWSSQKDTLKPAYKAILTKFSDRFVAGFDFGPENRQSAPYLRKRIANIRLILRDLPEAAKHAIGYRNAWKLLTGGEWE